jgi:spore germination cell wall hydrolase CwlJ-like protein
MFQLRVAFWLRFGAIVLAAGELAGCASMFGVAQETDERQCLARVMYFESNRSSDEGMLAVGTVVMNRLQSGRYGRTICGVVGARNQFAPGALTSPMTGVGRVRALRNADRVLAGARMPNMQGVEFFHTAGLDYPYRNMQYRLVAGGNAFYEKRYARPGEAQQTQLAAIARQQGLEPPMPPARRRDLAPLPAAVAEAPLPPPEPQAPAMGLADPVPLPPDLGYPATMAQGEPNFADLY